MTFLWMSLVAPAIVATTFHSHFLSRAISTSSSSSRKVVSSGPASSSTAGASHRVEGARRLAADLGLALLGEGAGTLQQIAREQDPVYDRPVAALLFGHESIAPE